MNGDMYLQGFHHHCHQLSSMFILQSTKRKKKRENKEGRKESLNSEDSNERKGY